MRDHSRTYVVEPFRVYDDCPKERVYVIEAHALGSGGRLHAWPPTEMWVFGPDTKHPWPAGDYYNDGEYVEEASIVPTLCSNLVSVRRYGSEYRMAMPILREFYIDRGL